MDKYVQSIQTLFFNQVKALTLYGDSSGGSGNAR